ncbi:MAG: tetratricopeptide repeat protein [Betaproteobacteria bacterium]|nr:tetratricopeptide repeat protein [Betaproteobacteria bacterium]
MCFPLNSTNYNTMLPRALRLPLAAAILFFAFAGTAVGAPADDLREAQKLYQQGKLGPALEKVDAYLKVQPREPQGRFLKGLVLTEQKKTQEAIQVFTGLTEDFPELPEPYNNLAVLYASLGNYDKAKSALELAIHTHPSYATAHENLGDIYAQLASRAYDRALQLDKNNATAQVKLSMVKDIFVAEKRGTKPESAKASAKADPAKAEGAKGAPAKAEPPKGEPVKVEPPKGEPAKVEPAKGEPARPAASGDDKQAVTAALESWAKAWSAKDVKGYLAAYAPDFETPAGEARPAWEKQREERIERPKSIEVALTIKSVKVSGGEAVAVVRQAYRSDALKSTTTKTMKLVKSGDRWLIKQERVGG